MAKWIFSKEEKWFKKWNDFILTDTDSTFLQSIYRVNSYEKYGMDWELLLCIDDEDTILLGSANVIVKLAFFKLYICSYGPTANQNFKKSEYYDEFLINFKKRAKEVKAFASQVTMVKNCVVSDEFKSIDGSIFTNISYPKYSNKISLKDNGEFLLKEDLIKTFLPRGRTSVRGAYRNELVCKFPTTEKELQQAYSCFETNAKVKAYNVRSWNDMKDFMLESVNNKMAYVVTAWYKDEIQGAILLERSSNMLSYTMGGVYRHSPDLLTGYFLQVEAMMLSKSLGLELYDVSFGGPKEVQRFKSMFNPRLSENYRTIHFKNSNIRYFIFSRLYGVFKDNIPKIMAIKKKLFSILGK